MDIGDFSLIIDEFEDAGIGAAATAVAATAITEAPKPENVASLFSSVDDSSVVSGTSSIDGSISNDIQYLGC